MAISMKTISGYGFEYQAYIIVYIRKVYKTDTGYLVFYTAKFFNNYKGNNIFVEEKDGVKYTTKDELPKLFCFDYNLESEDNLIKQAYNNLKKYYPEAEDC